MSQEKIIVTVAVCTHNRAQSLRVTLESLAGQVGVTEPWELLVIENACTDSTADVVREFERRCPVRLVSEPTLGLSHARNRALSESQGELLVFTDDDVRVAPNWLAAYCDAARRHPESHYFGGRILVDMVVPPPRWFRDETRHLFDGILVNFDLGDGERSLAPEDPMPIGASFALRRELLERNGGFRADLGVTGKRRGQGEETEYLIRARVNGARGQYVPGAICWHPAEWRRFELARLYEHGLASGVAHKLISGGAESGSLRRAAAQAIRGLNQLLMGRGDRFRRCVVNIGFELGLRRAGRHAG